MFKRVGKEIKILAKVLVILGMIPIVVGTVIGAFYLIGELGVYPVVTILAAIVVVLLGYVILRLCNMMLYSWGEVVDRVTRIDEKLEKMMDRPVPAAPIAPPYAAPSNNYAPPSVPPVAPVKPAPVAPVAPAPVKAAPVVSAPVVSAPAATVTLTGDSGMDDEYTHAAVSRPVPGKFNAAPVADPSPKPIYSAPVRPVAANWTCPACGQVNNADGSWCRNCGTKKST